MRRDISYEDSKCREFVDSLEGGSMKLMRVCLSLAILLTGCYSYTPVTKETPSTLEATFRLNDGTKILSTEYSRVEDGYQIVGSKWNNNKIWTEYGGFVRDDEIAKVQIVEFDPIKTVVAVGVAIGITAGAVGFAYSRFSLRF